MDFTRLKQLFTDEDAVSPVIGVILMVAITVILAAVIGTFVLGLGDNVQDSAPQANFQFEYDDGGDGAFGDGDNTLTITHTGGEDVDASTLAVLIDGTESNAASWSDTTVSTGSTYVHDDSVDTPGLTSGDSVRVVWTSPSGSNSNTIGQSTVPS